MMHICVCVSSTHRERQTRVLFIGRPAFSLEGMAVASAYHQTISPNWIV